MTTNLLHNAIVYNLREHGTVQVSTAIGPESVMLTVENTGDKLSPQVVSTLTEPFSAAPNAYAPTMQVSASAWQSSKASPATRRDPHPRGPPRWRPPCHGATTCAA